jgi:hypothetical protein
MLGYYLPVRHSHPIIVVLLAIESLAVDNNGEFRSAGASFHKFFKIRSSNHSQDKFSTTVSYHSKVLWALSIRSAVKKGFKLFQFCLCGDYSVFLSFPPKLHHGFLHGIFFSDRPLLEQLFQAGYAEVSKESSVLISDYCEMGVVALVG